jgi:hypothetical protein
MAGSSRALKGQRRNDGQQPHRGACNKQERAGRGRMDEANKERAQEREDERRLEVLSEFRERERERDARPHVEHGLLPLPCRSSHHVLHSICTYSSPLTVPSIFPVASQRQSTTAGAPPRHRVSRQVFVQVSSVCRSLARLRVCPRSFREVRSAAVPYLKTSQSMASDWLPVRYRAGLGSGSGLRLSASSRTHLTNRLD